MAYVVVQHMSPHHKSMMTELVGRETSLEVIDVVDGTKPQGGVIYVTPPNSDVVFQDGVLRLAEPSRAAGAPKPSVDRFMISLADAHGANSVAIILSGTGRDGAYGVQAIREAGGITIAQNSETAKYDGMPLAAQTTGCIDLVLSPAEIGTHLKKILSRPRAFDEFRKARLKDDPLADLMQILLARTRVDFREYKQTTVNRRIERRMVALGIDTIEAFTQYCRQNPSATDALFKDLLISVTRFFRDPGEFDSLKEHLPALLDNGSDDPLRIWVAGSATGEEAYSIAILISELLGGPGVELKNHVQIFATDIDQDALQVGRKGVYATGAVNDIDPKLVEKYFVRQQDGIRVIDSLRNATLFSQHNVCQDPPFQKIDLLCCRNLLIYFGQPLQQRVMSRFHYSLRESGILFLGTAESIAGSEELFLQDNRSAHIFRRRSISSPELAGRGWRGRDNPNKSQKVPERAKGPSPDRVMFDALVGSIGNNALLVTGEHSILRVFGDISNLIELNADSAIRMHLDLLRRPLREEARSLVSIALKNNTTRHGVRHLLAKDDEDEVRLKVIPMTSEDVDEKVALVIFEKVEKRPTGEDRQEQSDASDASVSGTRIQMLEKEVETTREALQQLIEELETSNEELQSLNEELQSTNEELQATNEELETSNEELQSTNEELVTVNEELQVTATELGERNRELIAVLAATPAKILVLDFALQVTQATEAAMTFFGLSEPLGQRHISNCKTPEPFPPLAPICSDALRLGQPTSVEVTDSETLYLIKASPFSDDSGAVNGVSLVIEDYANVEEGVEKFVDDASVAVMERTTDGRIIEISSGFAEILGTTPALASGQMLSDFLTPDSVLKVQSLDNEIVAGQQVQGRSLHLEMRDGRSADLRTIQWPRHDPKTDSISIYCTAVGAADWA